MWCFSRQPNAQHDFIAAIFPRGPWPSHLWLDTYESPVMETWMLVSKLITPYIIPKSRGWDSQHMITLLSLRCCIPLLCHILKAMLYVVPTWVLYVEYRETSYSCRCLWLEAGFCEATDPFLTVYKVHAAPRGSINGTSAYRSTASFSRPH